MLYLPKLENFEMLSHCTIMFLLTNWVSSTLINAPSSDAMHCLGLALPALPSTCPQPVCTDPGSATHAIAQFPKSNPNLPALPWIFVSRYVLPWLAFTLYCLQMGTTQSLFVSWLKTNCFTLMSWVDSNQYFQKMLDSVVESKRFLGKALEPWIYLIHLPSKLHEL